MIVHSTKRTMIKKILYGVSTSLILLSMLFSACSSDTADEQETQTETEVTETLPEETTTPETTIPSAVVTLEAGDITNTSATLRGEIKDMITTNPVQVCFELATQSGFYVTSTPEEEMSSAGEFSLAIEGLYAYMTYYYRTKMVDGDTVSYGEETSFTTGPEMIIDQEKNYTAVIQTNFGDITVELYPQDAPLAVNNFVQLSKQGYYKDIVFHRVVKDFMIQTGDPTGTGGGGPGYSFIDEEISREYVEGTLAMANRGANTNGSQFFICVTDLQTRLTKSYTIFGKVTDGMDVVKEIENVPVEVQNNELSKPTVDVHIVDIIITEE